MLFDSSKHCNLMLFSAKSELLLLAILPCVFEHVLVISGDRSVFMFCCALPLHHAHAFCFLVGMMQLVVLVLAICLVAVGRLFTCYSIWPRLLQLILACYGLVIALVCFTNMSSYCWLPFHAMFCSVVSCTSSSTCLHNSVSTMFGSV